MALEDNLVAIFSIEAKTPVGAGLLVEQDLVLTSAHVVNSALGLGEVQTGRPSGKVDVKLYTSSHRVKASVDSGDDAWSDPPATEQLGADLCLLRLDSAYENEIKPVRLMLFDDLPTRKFRVAGYPRGWDVDFSLGIVVGREEHGLYMLRPEPAALALVSTQTKNSFFDGEQRPPGIIYKGFSGSPVEVEGGIAGLLTEARERVSEATAYMVPVSSFPERVRKQARTPSEWWLEDWLTSELPHIAKRFADHMPTSALKVAACPEELYLDLIVTERHLEKKASSEHQPKDQTDIPNTLPLREVLVQAESPLLLIGDGGGGKTTSLLYAAKQATDHARADRAAPIPIYVDLARSASLDDLAGLQQLIAQSAHTDWEELSSRKIFRCRKFLFLFDSFNEIPEKRQRKCMLAFQSFVDGLKDHHVFVMASRRVPLAEQLSRPPWNFRTFEILRLTPDQVHDFLQKFDLATLYERMPSRLRELAGNPFMLLAIVRTLAGRPQRTLPRNEGELYQGFVHDWMEREQEKLIRIPEYSYERVKEPLLAYLAKRMTSAGQTSLALTEDLEKEVESRLQETQKQMKLRRRKGMPDDWTVDDCLNEILADGLLRCVDDQLYFMHQSVQEYYTGLFFSQADSDALASFMPALLWEFVSTYAVAEAPKHRLVPALLMMVGLLEDATGIIGPIAARNPVLAAVAISSANRVHPTLLTSLEQQWLGLLEHQDLRHRIVGCSCLALASMRSSQVVKHLVAFALSTDFDNSYVGAPALSKLGTPDAVACEISERVKSLPEDEFDNQVHEIAKVLKLVQSPEVVRVFFEHWRKSEPSSVLRHRIECSLATLDTTILTNELQRIRSGSSDPAVAADAERALADCASWEGIRTGIDLASLKRLRAEAQRKYEVRFNEEVENLRNANGRELLEALCRGSDSAVRAAAATIVAERHFPLADQIVDSVLRHNDSDKKKMVGAVVSLLGENAASKIVERSREKVWRVGSLDPDLVAQLQQRGEIPGALKKQIGRLGGPDNLLVKSKSANKDGTTTWILRPSSWSGFLPHFEIRVSATTAELYDCNIAARAFSTLTEMPGEGSLAELQRAVDHEDPEIQEIALRAVAERRVALLAERGDAGGLLEELRSAKSQHFIDLALRTLGKLRRPEALSLVNDVLAIRDAEWSDAHPVWGPSRSSPGWGDAIHQTLVQLNADKEIQRMLDIALASDPENKIAALKEISRWFADSNLGQGRLARWTSSARIQQLFGLAALDPTERVREAALEVLSKVKFSSMKELALEKLRDSSIEMKLAAANVLVVINAEEQYGTVANVLQEIVTKHSPELGRRAGKTLSKMPQGLEPFHKPIQEALTREEPERALQLIESAQTIFADDVDLWWWRGHVLRRLGRLDEAANSYEHAFELGKNFSVIPQALAVTLLEVGQVPRAIEMARRAVEIAPDDADAQATLAWSSYKGNATTEAIEAADRAVALDPVHASAVWIVVLGHLREANPEKARTAFQHALRVRQVLSFGYDDSFVGSFLEQLENIKTGQPEIAQLMQEIKLALQATDKRAAN